LKLARLWSQIPGELNMKNFFLSKENVDAQLFHPVKGVYSFVSFPFLSFFSVQPSSM